MFARPASGYGPAPRDGCMLSLVRGGCCPQGERALRPLWGIGNPVPRPVAIRIALTPPQPRATVRALPHPKGPMPC